MRGTGLIKIEQPFEGYNKVYYVNGGRCSGKVNKIINELVDCINKLQQVNQKYKEVIDKAINNSQYWIDYYTRLNSDERIALRLQENIDILKEVE